MAILEKRIALLGLDTQNADRLTEGKKAVLMAIAAASVLSPALEKRNTTLQEIQEARESIARLGIRSAKKAEADIASILFSDGTMKRKLSILSCDINYYTAGIEIYEYSTDEASYRNIAEGVRHAMLEETAPNYSDAALFVLMREACILHDIFSQSEQMRIKNRMERLAEQDEICRCLFSISFTNRARNFAARAVKAKNDMFRNPYLEGVSLLFPYLSRRTSIFIDTVILGTDSGTRREAVVAFLRSKGFDAEVETISGKTVIKVGNTFYSLFPRSIAIAHIPVQGINLIPYYE